jgi:hypothetical protein
MSKQETETSQNSRKQQQTFEKFKIILEEAKKFHRYWNKVPDDEKRNQEFG